MSDKAFFDTNIFVYAFDQRDSEKQEVARRLLKSGAESAAGVVSTQVVLEFASNLVRKLKQQPSQLATWTQVFAPFDCVSVTPGLVSQAMGLMESYLLSVWDSVIVAAALQSGCGTLHSKDLQNGLRIGELQVSNPFAVLA